VLIAIDNNDEALIVEGRNNLATLMDNRRLLFGPFVGF